MQALANAIFENDRTNCRDSKMQDHIDLD